MPYFLQVLHAADVGIVSGAPVAYQAADLSGRVFIRGNDLLSCARRP